MHEAATQEAADKAWKIAEHALNEYYLALSRVEKSNHPSDKYYMTSVLKMQAQEKALAYCEIKYSLEKSHDC